MANEYCALNDVKNYTVLNQDATGALASGRDDALLTSMITSVSRQVDRHCGWSFYNETLTNQVYYGAGAVRVDSLGWLVVNTHKSNVQSVSALSFKVQAAGAYTTVPTQYIVITPALSTDTAPGEFSFCWAIKVSSDFYNFLPYRNLPLWVQVSFVGGYPTTPQPIFEATREWTGYLYKLREAIPMSVVSFPQMGVTVRPMVVPPHIDAYLQPWKRVWQ